MAVNLSPVGGAAAQFFTNSGVILSGGKLYSYLAGTTTPAVTYTSSSGNTAHTNPIILDSAGRVPGGEIWLTAGISYKFSLYTSADVLIATYDNIVGINVSQDASQITYDPPFTGGVQTNVEAKLAQTVSVKDFGASPSQTAANNTTYIQAALNYVLTSGAALEFEPGTYSHTGLVYQGSNLKLIGNNTTLNYTGSNTLDGFIVRSASNGNASRCYISGIEFLNGFASLKIYGQGTGIYSDINITECKFKDSESGMLWLEHCSDVVIDSNYLENGGDNGVYYSFSRNAVISNNVLRNCGGSGSITIGYVDATITKAEGIVVIGNTIYADAAAPLPSITWTYGIDAVYCERCSIVGNAMYNTADSVAGRQMKSGIGLEEHIIGDVFITGNKITNVPEEGIRIGGTAGAGWTLNNIIVADNSIFKCRTAIDVSRTINSLITNNKITRCNNYGVNVNGNCSGITVSGNTMQDVNQQGIFGAFIGVYAQAPNTNVVGNHFVDSQTGGIFDNVLGSPTATYSVDGSGNITLYSLSVPIGPAISTTGKTWGQIKADIEANFGWTLTLFAGCDLYAPALVRRTGFRWSNNVQEYNVPSVMTTAEPYYYVLTEAGATNSQVFGNTYKTNVGTLPNNHGNLEYFLNNATNVRTDVSLYGARQHYAAAVPAAGTWIRGDIVWNTLPSAAGVPGWMCVAGGTPGTWKAMAVLAA